MRKPRNKRLTLNGYGGYTIDERNHRIYNKHNNLLKPLLDSKGVTCVQLINDEGKRRMVPLYKLTHEKSLTPAIAEVSVDYEKEVVWAYYQLVNDSNRNNSQEYWATMIRKTVPEMSYDEVKEVLWYLLGK